LPAAQSVQKKIMPTALFDKYNNLVCGAFDFVVFFSLLEIIIDLPIGFPINNIISLLIHWY